jgi:flagella basal body P-ring formation protein FlgA
VATSSRSFTKRRACASRRARALQNGGVGERIRLENVQGGRALEAIVTSAGAARAD